MKRSKLVLMLTIVLFGTLLAGCFKRVVPEQELLKPNDAPFYTPEEHQVRNWQAEEIWEEKLKSLSETKIPEFEAVASLNKDYVLNLARYQQAMSPDGFRYDEQRQVYLITNADVKYYAKFCLGISDFDYSESSEYNKNLGTFECTQYPDFGFVKRIYENKKLVKLPNDQWEFSIDVVEVDSEAKPIGEPVCEIYVVSDDEAGFKVISVSRSAREQQAEEQTL